MLTEFVEIRDFFDDPYEIMMLAKQQSFVERHAHYHNTDGQTFFNGVRSRTLLDIDINLYERVYKQIIRSEKKETIQNKIKQAKINNPALYRRLIVEEMERDVQRLHEHGLWATLQRDDKI